MLELNAYAKVNLGLSVTGKRADGFHELDTLFARVNVFDTVRLGSVPSGITLRVKGADLPTDEGNLCYRAAQLYLAAAGVKNGLAIDLVKRLPVAAGLGGGSSDAAAVLRGAARLYPAKVDLHTLALALGSDVPFFVMGTAAARGRGRGELLEPLVLPPLHLVLVNPLVHVTAAEAYKNLSGFTDELALEKLLKQLSSPSEPTYFNALQRAVVQRYPEIAEVLAALKNRDLRGVLMSGSGSTCFGLAKGKKEAADCAAAIKREFPAWWVVATQTV